MQSQIRQINLGCAGCGSGSSCARSMPAPIQPRLPAFLGVGTAASHVVPLKSRTPARSSSCVSGTRRGLGRFVTSCANATDADRSPSSVRLLARVCRCSTRAPDADRAPRLRCRALPSPADFDSRKIRSRPTPAADALHIVAPLLPPSEPRHGYRSCFASPAAPR